MTAALNNIEPIARAICARDLAAAGATDIPELIERYWRVAAALLEAGLIDEEGNHIPHSFEDGQAAWRDWLDSGR